MPAVPPTPITRCGRAGRQPPMGMAQNSSSSTASTCTRASACGPQPKGRLCTHAIGWHHTRHLAGTSSLLGGGG